MSWSLDDVCDADDIECQNPQISNPGEIIYGQCYRHATLRRLLKKLVGKCARHRCKEGYKCVLEGDSISCEIAFVAARLRHLLVHVGKNLETSNMELCGQFIGPAVNGKVIVTMCNTLPEGQIVKLTSVNDDLTAFHLTEVEVYGV
ncbi:Hypothetical predicted protein [Mytilus galloprovincialis]|uniref:Uncharacterized protein n=1 Tax=Mytilus galloprovincialis TaxID=29158 RepID=A0A8B6ELB3_MYTGA|nr:Hypothetical predicted protein [Mytilus galloprovincialis]